jgi:predicted nucleic acid-binding protein
VEKIIIDTGPLVALIDDTDQYHSWAKAELSRLRPPLWTCDAVLSETSFLLMGYPKALSHLRIFLNRGLIVPEFASLSRASHIFELMETYHTVPMSFADACLVCMVETNPGASVFTLDRDFRIYRQQRRRLIPLIAPF